MTQRGAVVFKEQEEGLTQAVGRSLRCSKYQTNTMSSLRYPGHQGAQGRTLPGLTVLWVYGSVPD